MWACIAPRYELNTPLVRCRFPYVGADLRSLVIMPGISEHCKTTETGWCITRCACLLPQLSPSTLLSLTTKGGLRLSRSGAWLNSLKYLDIK